jgi:glucokinase
VPGRFAAAVRSDERSVHNDARNTPGTSSQVREMTSGKIDKVAIAVDVGGTGIKCAVVDPHGRMLHTERHRTGADRGPAAVLETIVDVAKGLVDKAFADGREPVAIGVAVPGIVDEEAGIARWSANLGLRDAPLQHLVADRTGVPTVLGHDVRAGALAEARLGAGRAESRMLFVAIGTGIASAFVVEGRVDAGAHGASGELGHIVVRDSPDAPICGCGLRGCLEALASAAAIARAYGNGETAAGVARRVEAGEEAATQVWTGAIDALAAGLLTAIALYDPSLVVLGGGLAHAGDTLLEPLNDSLRRRHTFHQLPRLARAELGDEAGCYGAALLALDRYGVSA